MQADPLAVECSRCGARPGSRCTNYRGRNKQTCPGRGQVKQQPLRRSQRRQLKQGYLFPLEEMQPQEGQDQ